MSLRALPACRVAGIWVAIGLADYIAAYSGAANAKTIKVFALGASNTNGKGVSSGEAWPAQLERMLRAKGYEVVFGTSAINGDTSAGVLSRTSTIPDGTQVVVFDICGDNDQLRWFCAGADRGQQSQNRCRDPCASRRADPGAISFADRPQRSGGADYQADGIHLSAQAHARMAAYLLPKVIAAAK